MALAMMVKTCLWLAGEVRAQRDRPLIRQLIERVRRWAAHRPLLCLYRWVVLLYTGDARDLARPCAYRNPGTPPAASLAQHLHRPVVKRYTQRRVGAVERRIVDGPPARVETRRRRSPGDGVINTAYSERCNATCCERLASLTRRSRALARRTVTLQHGMYLIGTVYNFCTPHARLRVAGATTPAMAAGITDHCWSVQELLSYHVPLAHGSPPKHRGRPSHALKRLIECWCGDHG